jgi:hypothetical protein
MTPAPCTLPAAKAAIVHDHVRSKLNGDTAVQLDPSSVDEVVCAGDTMGVTIASGGTAGDIGYVLFRRTGAGWKAALVRGGYKVGLFRAGADVVVSQPVYRANDPNCCPSGGFDHFRWHWNGTRFTVARSWHTRSFRPYTT